MGVRGHPETLLEGAAEMADAQRDLLRQLVDLDRAQQMLPEIPIDLSPLPRRQATASARRPDLGCSGKQRHEPQGRCTRAVGLIAFHRVPDLIEEARRLGAKPMGSKPGRHRNRWVI